MKYILSKYNQYHQDGTSLLVPGGVLRAVIEFENTTKASLVDKIKNLLLIPHAEKNYIENAIKPRKINRFGNLTITYNILKKGEAYPCIYGGLFMFSMYAGVCFLWMLHFCRLSGAIADFTICLLLISQLWATTNAYKEEYVLKIPQLRILTTSFCGRSCLYCRPTGEGDPACGTKKYIDMGKALAVCRLYREQGGSEVKITGGDPVFWPDLVDFVRHLKEELKFQKVEVITRSPEILKTVHSLVSAGMDVLNFSLDTTDEDTYEKITGCQDYVAFITAIRACAQAVPVKINAVVLKGINDMKVRELVTFCEEAGVQQLKLLDVIRDLQDMEKGNAWRLGEIGTGRLGGLYVSLASICEEIKREAVSEEIVQQGGLGHPMNEFKMPSGLTISVKNSENGAWYGKICESCASYPCHDALMAVRLTPDNRIQYCLLNEDASIPLDGLTEDGVAGAFSDALKVYEDARFMEQKKVGR